MSYKHQSLEERHYIEISLRNEEIHEVIAESLDRSQSSITREIARNTGLRGYRYKQNHKKTIERHQNKLKAVKIKNEVKDTISDLLIKYWIPEQVSGWLKKEDSLLWTPLSRQLN